MPNKPKAENVQRGLRVHRELDAKVQKRFRADGDTIKDAYIRALRSATAHVTLTAEEKQSILRETEAVKRNRKSKEP